MGISVLPYMGIIPVIRHIFFTSEGIHMYYILIKRQLIRLSNGICNIRMVKRMLLKINNKNEK